MATAVLYIGWNRPHVGREADAFRFFTTELSAALDKFQADGFFEHHEQVGLTAHGCGPGGFALLLGERARLDELRRTDEFERIAMTLGMLVSELAVVPGVNRAGMQAVLERRRELMSKG